jgi:hypothetical protein
LRNAKLAQRSQRFFSAALPLYLPLYLPLRLPLFFRNMPALQRVRSEA